MPNFQIAQKSFEITGVGTDAGTRSAGAAECCHIKQCAASAERKTPCFAVCGKRDFIHGSAYPDYGPFSGRNEQPGIKEDWLFAHIVINAFEF